MKKKILLFTSVTLFTAAIFMSNAGGPAHISWQNRTGSDGTTNHCGTAGCHVTPGSYTSLPPEIRVWTIPLQNDTSYYIPADTYQIIIDCQSVTAPKWGFQVSASYNDGSYHPAGTFFYTNGNLHDTTINGFQIVEPNTAQTILNSSIGMVMNWVAPADTTIDSVTFYCTINLVNGDNLPTGDNYTNFKRTLRRSGYVASVKKLAAEIKCTAYPNPVTDQLNISIEDAEKGNYDIRVFDINGKVVEAQTAAVGSSYKGSVNTSAWAKGIYHLQLRKGDAQKTIAITKQ